jgi:hypothetical protein
MPLPEGRHLELLGEAIAADGAAHRALLDGDRAGARSALMSAAELYRGSWEAAPPGSYGRLIGMLKAAVLAGGGVEEAAYVRAAVAEPASPPAWYALALAALAEGRDEDAARAAEGMLGGSEAFVRTAGAISALAARDAAAYEAGVRQIVADFEGRSQHLTGVPIADTALLLEVFAERRGLACHPASALLPA